MFYSLNRVLSSFKDQQLFCFYTHHFKTTTYTFLPGRLQTSKEGYTDSPTPCNQLTPSRIALAPAHSLEAAYNSQPQNRENSVPSNIILHDCLITQECAFQQRQLDKISCSSNYKNLSLCIVTRDLCNLLGSQL